MMTVTTEEAPANFVPAAAVIRRGLALFRFTGRKGHAGARSVRGEIPGLNPGTAFDTGGLEAERG